MNEGNKVFPSEVTVIVKGYPSISKAGGILIDSYESLEVLVKLDMNGIIVVLN
jgi:hypothetical protein